MGLNEQGSPRSKWIIGYCSPWPVEWKVRDCFLYPRRYHKHSDRQNMPKISVCANRKWFSGHVCTDSWWLNMNSLSCWWTQLIVKAETTRARSKSPRGPSEGKTPADGSHWVLAASMCCWCFLDMAFQWHTESKKGVTFHPFFCFRSAWVCLWCGDNSCLWREIRESKCVACSAVMEGPLSFPDPH